jgi:hypothetical protein
MPRRDDRQALLSPKYGSLYPEIPADHWLPAWQAAMRRADRVWQEKGSAGLIHGRLLSDQHFKFRRGQQREPGQSFALQRLSDPTAAETGDIP